MGCKQLNAVLIDKHYEVSECDTKEYSVSYCIRYRPVWAIEWILLRWRWNDKGVWTDNGIFNDWNI